MSNEKMAAIAEKLLTRSKVSEIPWAGVPGQDTRFFISFPEYTVAIRRPVERQYVLSIYNQNGAEAYSLLGEDRRTGVYRTLEELFEIAGRIAPDAALLADDLNARLDSGELLA